MRRCAPSRRLQAQTSALASGLKEPPEAFAYLLMRQELTAFEGSFAAFHCLDKPVLLGEVARDYILHDFIRFAAMFVGALAKPSLQIGSEMDLHPFQRYVKSMAGSNGDGGGGAVFSGSRVLQSKMQPGHGTF
jgi:hypothetical protein